MRARAARVGSDEELLDRVLELEDLVFQLRPLVRRDRRRDHRPRHAARSPQRLLIRDKDVGNVLRKSEGAGACEQVTVAVGAVCA